MAKKLLFSLFLVMLVISIAAPVSAEASDGTVISTVVPQKYTITFHIDGGGSVECDGITYKSGDTIQVEEGTDVAFKLQPPDGYKLKSVSYNGQDVTKQVSDGVVAVKSVQQNATLSVIFTKIGGLIAPATGDTSHILLWSMLAFGSLIALIGITFKAAKLKYQ